MSPKAEIGAANRFNFSVVGDVVNLASRLEQMGKVLFPLEADVILVGSQDEATGGQSPDFGFIDCGLQEIRGRDKAELVYRLLVPIRERVRIASLAKFLTFGKLRDATAGHCGC